MSPIQRQWLARQKLLPIFAAKVLGELLTLGRSSHIDTARRTLESLDLIDGKAPLKDAFDRSYSELLETYPAEYILLNECLCAQVSKKDSVTAYREQAVAGIKSDLSIFRPGGKSCGYEVKSRYDRLDRLPDQLQTYQQVFSHTYVVTDHKHAPRVMEDSPASVGVLSVSGDGIQELRAATEKPELIHLGRLFSLLRKDEYLQLIRAEFGTVPQLPNTQIYQACLQLFRRLDGARAQELVTEILLRRQSRPPPENDRAWRLPRSLRALGMTGNLDQSELLRLAYVLDQ